MRLLIAEDDVRLLRSLSHILQRERYLVDGVDNGEDALLWAETGEYSLRTSSPTSSRKLPPGADWASRHRARARSQLASSRGTTMALSMVISPHRNQDRPRFSRTSFSKVWGFPFLKSR